MAASMAVPTPHAERPLAGDLSLSVSRRALWLAGTVLLALAVYYFVGIDQGAVSRRRCPPGTPGDDPELFSRAIQANVGIGVGIIAMGCAMGALFAVVYCLAAPRSRTMRRAGCRLPWRCRCSWGST